MSQFEQINETELATAVEKAEALAEALVEPSCKCTSRWIDEACIWSVIEHWNPEFSVLCYGCYWNRPSQREHACLGHTGGYLFPDASPEDVHKMFAETTRFVLRQPETVEALFKIYLETHPEGTELQRNLDWGIQRLMKTRLDDLQAMFNKRDRSEHLRE